MLLYFLEASSTCFTRGVKRGKGQHVVFLLDEHLSPNFGPSPAIPQKSYLHVYLLIL